MGNREMTQMDVIENILIENGYPGYINEEEYEGDMELFEQLYTYFLNSGDMPYGVAKCRDGMPDVWIFDRLDQMGLVL